MRGAARGLIAGLVAGACALSIAAAADAAPTRAPSFERVLRELDGEEYLEDEPIWVCMDDGPFGKFRLLGTRVSGERIHREFGVEPHEVMDNLAGGPVDLVQVFRFPVRPELHPLDPDTRLRSGGLPAGRYEVRTAGRDSGRVVARFSVLLPRGSELVVRSALARARRLVSREVTREEGRRLYNAVLARYPRTSYRTTIYANLWRFRPGPGPRTEGAGTFLEEVFAHFHDSCFGRWALEEYVRTVPAHVAIPQLRRLVGLYPDTPLSRAAARYL